MPPRHKEVCLFIKILARVQLNSLHISYMISNCQFSLGFTS
ncbi:Uncharacterised protein [Streptococcus criceti]|uniref:Uncharacterized protein n=1 Tax=Streptococcus criceti HS-6 TaxID=873449 RepID=G5JPV7_STRCG|nr:hypothetical protein STRCR_1691 [Streptococcus criceti HS-6]SUN43199.1 Uncharacterised protein [Streptococcus criceti]